MRCDLLGLQKKSWVACAIGGVAYNNHRALRCRCLACGTSEYFLANNFKKGLIRDCTCDESKFKTFANRFKLKRIRHDIFNAHFNEDKIQYYYDRNRKDNDYGVYVCTDWIAADGFEKWARANGYADDKVLVRTDPNGSYTPENCWWGTIEDVAESRIGVSVIHYKGSVLNVSDWAEYYNMNKSTIYARYYKGWSFEEIFDLNIDLDTL